MLDAKTTATLEQGFWVFGYGSLVWQPEFEYAERELARLDGFQRSFCMWSIHHRGTEADPGLVLALDAAYGHSCDGVAFRVGPEHAVKTLRELRERELISSAYVERIVSLKLRDGRAVDALVYVISPDHVQYCGGMALEEQAQIIAHATGGRGENCDYLYNTAGHLAEIGLRDADLDWLSERVREIRAK